MLKTRLWMGSLLAALALGIVVVDRHLAPWFPFLALGLSAFCLAGVYELRQLLPQDLRPPAWPTFVGVALILAANWSIPLAQWAAPERALPNGLPLSLGSFTATAIGMILYEMYHFRGPGQVIPRTAMGLFTLFYLGLLPSFLAQLRWIDTATFPISEGVPRSSLALTLAVFVPKCCDIGAYLTGRAIGRHRMTPYLSPKKTWEGFSGGMLLAVLTAVGLAQLGEVFRYGWPEAVVFGLIVGLAGVFGDLAESMLKRDCQTKDASQTIPGFGGVLDVIDSLLLAAPLAYWWLQ